MVLKRFGITSSCSQILVDKLDRRGTLSHCRRNALNRAAARIARSEHTRHACLQEIWLSFEAPDERIERFDVKYLKPQTA